MSVAAWLKMIAWKKLAQNSKRRTKSNLSVTPPTLIDDKPPSHLIGCGTFEIPFSDIRLADVFNFLFTVFCLLLSRLKQHRYLTQVHRNERIAAVGSASATIVTVGREKMGLSVWERRR